MKTKRTIDYELQSNKTVDLVEDLDLSWHLTYREPNRDDASE
jgi:hypothetical protein